MEIVAARISKPERGDVPADRHDEERRAKRHVAVAEVDAAVAFAHQIGGNAVCDAERAIDDAVEARQLICRRVTLVRRAVVPRRDKSEGVVLELEVRGIRGVKPDKRRRPDVRLDPRGRVVGGDACRDDIRAGERRGGCRAHKHAVVCGSGGNLRDVEGRIRTREERRGGVRGKPVHANGRCRCGGRAGGERNRRIGDEKRRTGKFDWERGSGVSQGHNAVARQANGRRRCGDRGKRQDRRVVGKPRRLVRYEFQLRGGCRHGEAVRVGKRDLRGRDEVH